jgi:hypothetical protein
VAAAAEPQALLLLLWLEKDVQGKFGLPPLHELDMAIGEASSGSLQLLLTVIKLQQPSTWQTLC